MVLRDILIYLRYRADTASPANLTPEECRELIEHIEQLAATNKTLLDAVIDYLPHRPLSIP